MDPNRFDGLARALGRGITRRGVARTLAVFAAAGVGTPEGDAAKKCKGTKKKCGKACIPSSKVCCPRSIGGWCDGGETCCPPSRGFPEGSCAPLANAVCCRDGFCLPGDSCCPPLGSDPGGPWCAVAGQEFCCAAEQGGGGCFVGEKCCGPVPGAPEGLCVLASQPCPRSAGDTAMRHARVRSAKSHAAGRSVGR